MTPPTMAKPRARLSEAQVILIFQAKDSSPTTATDIAKVYGVSEKAIRDIWKGRTWSRETWHLDTSRPLPLKLTGRPKGSRDQRPRTKRAMGHEEPSTSVSIESCQQAAAWPISSVPHHSSLDDQLHEWDGFWGASALEDPFLGDWMPMAQRQQRRSRACIC